MTRPAGSLDAPADAAPDVRRSILSPLDAEGRAEAVAERIREAIFLGVFLDGDPLPSEAELSTDLAVSNKTLREALVVLRQEGLIDTKRGRGGGSFARSPSKTSKREVRQRLGRLSATDIRDLADEHRAVAGMAAHLAAHRADREQLVRLRSIAATLGSASTELARARADSQFHIEVALTSQSERLSRAEVRLQRESRDLLWLSEPGLDEKRAAKEHRAILEALAAEDAPTAREATERHVAENYRHLLDVRLRMRTT